MKVELAMSVSLYLKAGILHILKLKAPPNYNTLIYLTILPTQPINKSLNTIIFMYLFTIHSFVVKLELKREMSRYELRFGTYVC